MKIYCDNCKNDLDPSYGYCPICGENIPPKTLVGNLEKKEIKNPIFCPHCQNENIPNALFCSKCGKSIFKKPNKAPNYCPYCGEKNRLNANYCHKCKKSINNWYNKIGEVANTFGLSGDLSLYETMTKKYFNFFTDGKITIGRSDKNTITIPCQWVSEHHCSINISKKILSDINSSNGTFINRDDTKIKTIRLSAIDEFNLAGAFTFKVIQKKNLFIFILSAIYDVDECRKVGNMQEIDLLRNQYFIVINGDDKIYINKTNGKITTEPKEIKNYYSIDVTENKYYFSDYSKNIERELILKQGNTLPNNWEINN